MGRLLLFLLSAAVLLFSCGEKKEAELLVTSVFPLTWTVKNLYPTYEVYQLVKPGSNPHLYDLTPRDAEALRRAKKVFLIGNLEPFADEVPPSKRVA
ncbi:MAG: zinc ABC transporter solute-binding protein, partial [Aquificae bacterium]|nr:zinc ABC transporter solute-binding protein [Aquificota bacterium]